MTDPSETLRGIPEEFLPTVRVLAPEFFVEGAEAVYVAWSGDRVYVGREPAVAFRDKEGTPENVRVSAADLA